VPSIGGWDEQRLIQFVRQQLGLPPNLRQKIATPEKTAPVMQNGWTNYNSSVFYWLDGQGYGHIVGDLHDAGGATVAAGTTLFTLPFGLVYRAYRPITDNDGSIRNVLIATTGDVKIGDNGPAFRAGSTPNFGHIVFPTF
jgi:hypothetical protein